MAWFVIAAFVPAFVLAAVLVPLARRLALAANLVAAVRPDRLHTEPKPTGGGLAIAATVALVVGGAWALGLALPAGALPGWLPAKVHAHLAERAPLLVRLGLGALLFFIVGLLDDRFDLGPWPKLGLQAASAALVVVGFGIKATVWIAAPVLPELVSILWILAVVNAYNLFDHADGLAAATGAIVLAFLAAGQLMMGEVFIPGIALVAAGALAGFLIWNFPPAKIFMGDAGSHFIGYLLAALTISARYYFPGQGTSRFVVLVPLILLAVPLFDALSVTLDRLSRGASPMAGDATSHLGHRLLAAGWSPRRVVLFIAVTVALTGSASIVMARVQAPWCWLAISLVAASVLGVAAGRRLGLRPEARP
jgi:UDP-GlcNAc:undecaprenyl-phosphate GlcNAc-1-phosphate transferase